jgi:cytochrome P450
MTKTDTDTCTREGAAPHTLGPEFGQDPYPFLNALRDAGPVHRVRLPDGKESWWVTGYDEVDTCLDDHEVFSSQVHRALANDSIENSQALIRKDELLKHTMINQDPPDHTRMRKLVVRAFGAGNVEALRPRIERIADDLLDRMEAGPDEVDLVPEYAFPVPVGVICELLGIRYEDSSRLGSLVTNMIGAGSGEQAMEAMQGMKRFMLEKIEEKRSRRGDDVLTSLIDATDECTLSPPELPAMAMQILSAGHESSIFLISSGTFNLLREPEQLVAVRDNPELLPRAVEEIVRYEPPPVPGVFRYVTKDVDVGGTLIPEGSLAILSLAAANRDGRRIAEPDKFDTGREENPHLSFGGGVHYCLGARLARVEGEIAIGRLIRRFPAMRLAIPPEEVTRRPLNFLQRLNRLPVRLR